MMSFRDRFDRSKRRPSTRRQRIGFALFWLVLLSYAFVIPTNPSFNSESHLYLTFALVDHHTVQIDSYRTRLGDMSYWNGHYYSDKAPGMSFLAVPAYAGLRVLFPHKMGKGYEAHPHMKYAIPRDTAYLRYAISYILVMLPSAIFAVLLWLFLCQFANGEGWPLVLTVAYALGTIAFYYSTVYFSHQVSAMLVFGAFMVLYRWVRGRAPDRTAYIGAAAAGLLSGYAVINEYPTIVIAIALALYLLAVARSRILSLLAFAAGALPPALLGAGYNVAAFGKPFATGYMHVQSAMYHNQIHGGLLGIANPASYGISLPHPSALWEITFGAYRGIFLVSPVLLLFFVGLAYMWRRRDLRPEWVLCLAVVVAYFLMDSSHGADLNGWSGGWSVASRHLTPCLPFMILPMVFGLRSLGFRVALVALGAVSVAFMFMTVTGTGDFNSADHNPLVNEMIPNFVHGHMLVNWGFLLGLQGLPSLLPYGAIALLLVTRIVYVINRVADTSERAQSSVGLPESA